MVSVGMSETENPIGDILREWRKSEGKSTKAAGATVGVSGVQWHRYEAGDRDVPLERLMKISAVTGIHLTKLRPDLANIMRTSEPAQ